MKLGGYGLVPAGRLNENMESIRNDAPEVFNRGRELKSDAWSLGLALIHLGEKENPPKEVLYYRVQSCICNNDPPSLSSEKWSAECVDFVAKCLVKDVKERWSVKQLMEVSDWEMV